MPTPASTDTTVYWATELDSKRAAANILERIKRYRMWLKETGRAQRMTRSWRTYYGYAPDGQGDTSQTSQSGDQGEYVDVTTNDFATLVTQTAVLTTQNKPALHAIATNADYDSMAQTEFAQGLLEFYDRKHSVIDRDYETVVTGLLSGEGWEIEGWDPSAGKSLTDFVEGAPTNEGDIRINSYTPFRIAYEPETQDVDSMQWLAFKRRHNRFDLATNLKEKNPEAAQLLLEMSGDDVNTQFDEMEGDGFEVARTVSRETSGDLIWVWEFRHLPCPSLPNGRLIRLVSAECVIYDSITPALDEQGAPIRGEDGSPAVQDHGYPYKTLCAQRFSPDMTVGSIAGHTAVFDMLGLQELVDTMATMGASAVNAGGISNLWTPPGDKPSLSNVIGSMNFLQSKTKPELLHGIELSPQVAVFEEFIMKRMMRRLGQSDVSMGEVPRGMPGNLAALLEAKTVQYHSRGQASYAQMIERRATSMLEILKRFATTPRIAVLGGKMNDWRYKSWSQKDIDGVDRFIVESVSPLAQSYAGKMDAAQALLEHGQINGKQFMSIRETGRWESVNEAGDSNLMRVRKEKEMLQQGIGLPPVDVAKSFETGIPAFVDPPPGPDGKAPPCIRPFIYDKHWEDIPEYLAVADMPMARDNPQLVAAVTGVVEEKLRLMKKIDPVMLAVLKCPVEVAQAIAMAQPPPPGMGMPPGMPPAGVPQPPPPGPMSSPLTHSPPMRSHMRSPLAPGLPPGAKPIAAAKPPGDPLTGQQSPSPIINGTS